MREDGKIDYIELPSIKDGIELDAVKTFYQKAFGWVFTDYGSSYAAFSEGIDGGFDAEAHSHKPLVVLYAHNLEDMRQRVQDYGAIISRDIFSFPGGRRFHFQDPAGNEMAIWSEQ